MITVADYPAFGDRAFFVAPPILFVGPPIRTSFQSAVLARLEPRILGEKREDRRPQLEAERPNPCRASQVQASRDASEATVGAKIGSAFVASTSFM